MKAHFYNNRTIFFSSKRGSRMLNLHTSENDSLIVHDCFWNGISEDIIDLNKSLNIVKSKSDGNKIYIINRDPFDMISSGLWNIFEFMFTKPELSPTLENIRKDFKSADYFHWLNQFMYLTATKKNTYNNYSGKTIKDNIPQQKLLKLLNIHVEVFNNNGIQFLNTFQSDDHLVTSQGLIKHIYESLDNCDIVDLKYDGNLLKFLGFNFSDEENNSIKNLTSQKQGKLFYKMFLEYMLTQNINSVINGFKDIYGKCSAVRNSSLVKIHKNDEIINHVNNEVKIYNELKQYTIS